MNELTVQFIGSGDAFGSGGRLQTCIHLLAPDFSLLIDCGASSLIGLKSRSIDPNSVKVILLSHLHGDHFGGLPFFLLDAQLVSKRTSPLNIVGPVGTASRIRDAQEVLFPGSSQVQQKFAINYLEWTDRHRTTIGEAVAVPFEVVHASGAPSYALRVQYRGKVIAYSGDTEWTDALIAAEFADDGKRIIV